MLQATGRVVRDRDGLELLVQRRLPVSSATAWEWLTSPRRLKRWAEHVSVIDKQPLDSRPQTRFTANWGPDAAPVTVSLADLDGSTIVYVSHRVASARQAGVSGPALEFTLDRLVAAQAGAAMPAKEAYLPQQPYYERLAMDGDPDAWPAS
ncbi:MAG: ATPase [Rhodoglobus sp.]|nr:ATPase [Rhodoglobus sp.]